MFTGSRPIHQPNWGYGVAKRSLYRLQPLCEFIQQLLQEGLMGANLLQSSGSTTPLVGDYHVDVSRAKLS
jgi:hypothetical protein